MDEEDEDDEKECTERKDTKSDHLSLRHAWDQQAGRPIWAWDAERQHSFQCPDCHTPVILKRGIKRIAHFAHKVQEQDTKCCRYGQQINESQLHKEVKLLLVEWIRLGRILRFRRTCMDLLDTHCVFSLIRSSVSCFGVR